MVAVISDAINAFGRSSLEVFYTLDVFLQSHLLFKNLQVFGPLLPASEEEKNMLQQKFQLHGMLPNVSLKQVFKVNWVTRFGTKYRNLI